MTILLRLLIFFGLASGPYDTHLTWKCTCDYGEAICNCQCCPLICYFPCSLSMFCYLCQCCSLDLLYFCYNCYFWHFCYIFVKLLSCSLLTICYMVFALICYFHCSLSMICYICQCCSLDLLFCFFCYVFKPSLEGVILTVSHTSNFVLTSRSNALLTFMYQPCTVSIDLCPSSKGL